MIFSSITFLFGFFVCALLLYFLAPKKLKNAALLLLSLVFYAWGEPKFVFVMLASVLQGYIFGLLIEKYGGRKAKVCLALSVCVSLGLLGYCKYADFLIGNFNALTGLSAPLLHVTLPIGISFYTFQILSYTVDVYRGEVAAQRNFIDLAAYVAMFPQLIAGPIVRYADVEKQLKNRSHTMEKCAYGTRRFVLGLAKKVLLANTLGELCSIFKATDDPSVLFYWLYAVAYMLHIYFDFSGYSDMAIGIGKIFGFDFSENFNYPYMSSSVTEFWRRWHISLGTWFRDYVYIPLGGNRVGKARWLMNIMVVWALTGIWHGAAWNFAVWGLFYGVLLMIEKLWLNKLLKKTKVFSHIYALLLVMIGFVIFDASDLSGAVDCLGCMFGFGGIPAVSAQAVYYLKSYAVIFVLAILASTPLFSSFAERLRRHEIGEKLLIIAEPIALTVLLCIVTGYLVDGSFNPFLYFRF